MNISLQIHQKVQEGKSRTQIMSELGISGHTLSKYLIKENTKIGEKIIELRNQGKSLTEIKSLVNASKSTISKYISRTNITEKQIRESNKEKHFEKKSLEKEIRLQNTQISKGSKNGLLNRNLRKRKKSFLMSPANGKCQSCGYDKCTDALVFHHKDPLTKHFFISGNIYHRYGIKRLIEEASKCILLCSNCHFETHSDLIDVSEYNLDYSSLEIPEEFLLKSISEDNLQKERLWLSQRLSENRSLEEIDLKINDVKNIEIREENPDKINEILSVHHYLGKNRKQHIKCFSFLNNDKIIGGCFISNPVRKNFNGHNTCEINRFVLLSHHKNLGSRCLSLIIEEMKKDGRFKYLASYADPTHHSGTIYKAANFKITGSLYKTYSYSGIHKKTIYERARRLGISEYEYAEKLGLKKIIESPKIKFIYDLKSRSL